MGKSDANIETKQVFRTQEIGTCKNRAAIYVSEKIKKDVGIAKQIAACQRFLDREGLLFSGDLFLEKEGNEYINELISARARSNRFDYLVSYVFCRGYSDSHYIGIIACLGVKNFLNCSKKKTVLEG